MAALSGNAWGGKGKAAGGADRGQAPGQPAAAQADQHVPVKEFNAAEVKDWLKKSASYSRCQLERRSSSYIFRFQSFC
jgi:hypothetical protein